MRIGVAGLDRIDPYRGIGRYTSRLVAGWRRAGHHVTSVPINRSPVPVLRNFPLSLGRPAANLDALFLPDLLLAPALGAGTRGVPTITTVHDLGVVDCAEDRLTASMLTRVLYRASLLAIRRSSAVVTDSMFTTSRLSRYARGIAARAQTVHLGVDAEVFHVRARVSARERLTQRGVSVRPTNFVVLYVGAEYPRKDLDTLLSAFSLARRRIPDATLVKAGAAYSDTDRKRTLASIKAHNLRLGQDVYFAETIDDALLAELYCGANVYATASRYEGFGLPLLEAMASGTPAVVTRTGALPEVGGPHPMYVAPGDAAAMADHFCELAYGGDTERRGGAAASQRARTFRWEDTARKTLEALTAGGVPVSASA